ncbi:hypothetical protein CcaverHIS002_0103790 [Cutaneotrichosporon cavernicola]|uniref:Uncharacterized protein n=1 Tax=Cutaneotrichosporon cavernicola TaxID=279322 RepID=A0AA48HY47_9TREE|nr:uncharacterized protein CcaverHIS019_0103720 [Cutaneotrichosporon cavernicola]BEI79850.1 hypothetical protein CcaverHIS002_0103790 [Cutaneotrichosporon cavernicola]BEI87654.1 hypothetical protein CcaverHIS019_0103720 [Cutaneotrichosporon cavernicola]BEI95426.1 hypothetical protein CcaverHIS631_0103750 [Cutaneotrichosporon cavernicola]
MAPAVPTSALFAAPPGHLTLIMASRRTASFHLPSDPRFSFYLYVPRAHPVTRRSRGEDVGRDGTVVGPPVPISTSPTNLAAAAQPPARGFPLLVVMHDSSRDAEKLRDAWAALAEEEGVVVLSPHFPCDIKFPDGPDNYKRLVWETSAGEEVRYDAVLLDMIDCVAAEWGCIDTRTFSLVGFSGGGQFVHRFLYLYPERVHAVSIGAPGRATPLIDADWPEGIRDAPTTVSRQVGVPLPNAPESDEPAIPGGRPISVSALAERTRCGAVAVQLLIGSEDTWRPVQPDGSLAAHSRFDATQAVAKSFDDAGIAYEFTVVPGVKHEGHRIREVAMPWVRRHVRPAWNTHR